MNLLQVFFIISGIIILILALDIAKKQKFNALHFFIFIFVGFGLLAFTFFPRILDKIGGIFGLQRGADVLVYSSIIFLVYFVLLLLRKVENNSSNITTLVREIAINNSSKKIFKGENVILIRAYNEEKVINTTIDELLKNKINNILVINDGSTDKTLLELNKIINENIVILNHYQNRGAGAALETGFEYLRRYSEVDYIITFDADGQHDVNDIKKVKDYFDNYKDVDVFIGSRFFTKTQNGMPLLRKLILKLGIVFTYFVSNIKLSDSHNGFRVFRKNVLNKVRLTIDDMSYASELIDIISSNNIPFMEIPVNIKYTKYSLSKGQKNSNAIYIALKFIWNKFFK